MPVSKRRHSRKPRKPRASRHRPGCRCAGPRWEGWSFPVPPDELVVACCHVIDEGATTRLAMREVDRLGEAWTFTCGARHRGHLDDWGLVHLHHLIEATPELEHVGDLDVDEAALLDLDTRAWHRVLLDDGQAGALLDEEEDWELEELEDDLDDQIL